MLVWLVSLMLLFGGFGALNDRTEEYTTMPFIGVMLITLGCMFIVIEMQGGHLGGQK